MLGLGFDDSGLHSCAGAETSFLRQADDVAAPCVPHVSRSRSGQLVNVVVGVIVVLVVNWVQRVFQFSNTWNINGGGSVKRIGRYLVKFFSVA
jgi:hypothetical protein